MTKNIVQIVPRLPPYTDGVGDYSLKLAEQLLKDQQISTHFLVFQLGIEVPSTIAGFPVTALAEHNSQALLSALPPDILAIVLQYSNYPYLQGKLDAPFWLAKSLKVARERQGLKLVVMFHELPMLKWKQINILNPIQSIASRHLARTADKILTNSANFQKVLSGWLHQDVPCLPNFSTIGEPEVILPLSKREKQIIIFGSSDRQRVYQNHLPTLLETCLILGIQAIYDVGKPLNLAESYDFKGLHLVEMGFQPAEVVSQLFANSLFCCLDYSRFPGNLGKSTVFAACCAHGTVPLVCQYNPSEANGLEMNQHYLVLDPLVQAFNLSQLQTIADHANQWYNTHNLKRIAQVFTKCII
jgi:hypothetical protein